MSPLLREILGKRVRGVWRTWASEQPNPKPSWLVPWDKLSEPDKEVDRRIGEELFNLGKDRKTYPKRQKVSRYNEPHPRRRKVDPLPQAMTKSIITIIAGDGKLDVRLEFEPAAATSGPMTTDQAAAMAGLEAIKAWAADAGAESDKCAEPSEQELQ